MTDAPIIAAKIPARVDLEAGKDCFCCSCGRSNNQPFCNGPFVGTGLESVKFTADKDGAAALCQCKSRANAPFCDGTHVRLGDLSKGDPSAEQAFSEENAGQRMNDRFGEAAMQRLSCQ